MKHPVQFVRVIGGLCELCKRNARTVVPGVTIGAIQPHRSPSMTRVIGLRIGRSSTQLSAAEAQRVAGELLAAAETVRDVGEMRAIEWERAAAELAASRAKVDA